MVLRPPPSVGPRPGTARWHPGPGLHAMAQTCAGERGPADEATRSVQQRSACSRPRGPMDKASAHGAEDCRLESCRDHCHAVLESLLPVAGLPRRPPACPGEHRARDKIQVGHAPSNGNGNAV